MTEIGWQWLADTICLNPVSQTSVSVLLLERSRRDWNAFWFYEPCAHRDRYDREWGVIKYKSWRSNFQHVRAPRRKAIKLKVNCCWSSYLQQRALLNVATTAAHTVDNKLADMIAMHRLRGFWLLILAQHLTPMCLSNYSINLRYKESISSGAAGFQNFLLEMTQVVKTSNTFSTDPQYWGRQGCVRPNNSAVLTIYQWLYILFWIFAYLKQKQWWICLQGRGRCCSGVVKGKQPQLNIDKPLKNDNRLLDFFYLFFLPVVWQLNHLWKS